MFSGIKLWLVINEYRQADAVYEQVQSEYVAMPATKPTSSPEVNVPVVETSGLTVDFDKLIATNADVIGWLYCEDTPINYPVVQAEDNAKYLHAGLDGTYLRSGTLFADYRNGVLGEDRQFVLYGHSMKNKTMFGSLLGYKKQEYYEQHPVLYYLTPDAEYRIELFAGCVLKVHDIIYKPNPDEREWEQYFDDVMRRSTFDTDVTVSSEDWIIMLSTCSYEFDNARYVVYGKLVKLDV